MDRRTFLKNGALGALVLGVFGGAPLLGGCTLTGKTLRQVTDMGGREVSLPTRIEKVFCTNPIGTADVYCLAPDMLAGWNFKPSGDSQQYIDEQYLQLPSLGVWMGAGDTPNPEEIAQQDPDCLLCFWTADDNGVSMADQILEDTSMPVVLVDYDIRNVASTLRYVGDLLDCGDRAEELASYCEEKIEFIQGIVESVPSSERKSIYLAQSTGGLSTDPVGSMHTDDALALIGTGNVADLPGTVGAGMGMPTVSIEQIIEWNPDAVLVSEYTMSDYRTSNLYGEIKSDARWQQVECVKKGEVYGIPMAPFSWFGRPPSVIRLLGCEMLLRLLYPSHAKKIDIRSEAKEFYQLFLNYDLQDSQLDDLLKNTGL